MPRVCTISTHSERAAIDTALLDNTPLRDIAGQYGVSKSALARYRNNRLPAALTHARDAEESSHADGLLRQVRDLQARALTILDSAEAAGDLRTALAAIREARGNLELLARLMGELNDQATVNVIVSPEWQRVRAVVIAHLAPFPDARAAVASGLLALEAGTP